MTNNFPPILVGSPTSNHKSYCDYDWIDNTLLINYPNYKVRLFDNSNDNGEYVDRLNTYYTNKYGDNDKFLAIKSDTRFCSGLISKVCKGHNDIRNYAIQNNYSALFHLESDVFCGTNVLQELYLHKKSVVGALYYRDMGRFRKLMVQQRISRSPNNFFMKNFDQTDDIWFIDGTVKTVGHIGLGAVLIDRKVLEKIPFRYVEGVKVFPDSWWADDCHRNKIKIWADTALICEHRNAAWDIDVINKDNKY